MNPRRILALACLLLCVSAHAETLPTGIPAAPASTDQSLLACHATLTGLTVLGITLSMRFRTWFHH